MSESCIRAVLILAALSVVSPDFTNADEPSTAGVRSRSQEARPFVAYSWRPNPGVHKNIIPFYGLMNRRDLADPSRAIAALADMPEGHRVILSWDPHREMPCCLCYFAIQDQLRHP